ncbi:MAG: hypothetical protein V5A72_00250 [Candidatus Nanohaloarchaea archaeon]
MKPQIIEALKGVREGYDRQSDLTEREGVEIEKASLSKYFQRMLKTPVPMVEKSGHNYHLTEDGDYILNKLEEKGIDIQPLSKTQYPSVTAQALNQVESGDTREELENKISKFDYHQFPQDFTKSSVMDNFIEYGVLDEKDLGLEVTEKGEIQREILHYTADQIASDAYNLTDLVEDAVGENKYGFEVYLVEKTDDGVRPVLRMEEDFSAEDIAKLLSE